jgi:hypothetical protein
VTIVPDGYVWREITYKSLSIIARAITGTAWNGPRFFGLRVAGVEKGNVSDPQPSAVLSTSKNLRRSRRSSKETRVGQREGTA